MKDPMELTIAQYNRIEILPKWKGIPVPKFVTWRTDGVPDFKVIDESFRERCVKEYLCFICGQQLEYWIYFIGGPKSTERGLFVDGPMHRTCAEVAMEYCPFLRGDMDYAQHWDFSKHDKKIEFTGGENRQHEAPSEVCITRCRGFGMAFYGNPKNPEKGAWFFHVRQSQEIVRKPRGKA